MNNVSESLQLQGGGRIISKPIEVHAVSCTVHHTICNDFDITSFPAIRFVKSDSSHVYQSILVGPPSLEYIPLVLETLDIDITSSVIRSHTNQTVHHGMMMMGTPTTITASTTTTSSSWISFFLSSVLDPESIKKTILSWFGGDRSTSSITTTTSTSTEHHVSTSSSSSLSSYSSSSSSSYFPYHTKADILNDAYRSFHFMLLNSIYMTNDPITGTKKDTFKQFLQLLQKTMPPMSRSKMNHLIHDLLIHFESITHSEQELVSILKKYPPPPPITVSSTIVDNNDNNNIGGSSSSSSSSWSTSCTRGKPGMGYTCGLWELFHIMTIGVVEWNNNQSIQIQQEQQQEQIQQQEEVVVTATSSSTNRIYPGDAADILRNTIEQFFTCDICREEFLLSYDTCQNDRCHRLLHSSSSSSTPTTTIKNNNNHNKEKQQQQQKQTTTQQKQQIPIMKKNSISLSLSSIQLAVWLWETHNDVNVRLAHEEEEELKQKEREFITDNGYGHGSDDITTTTKTLDRAGAVVQQQQERLWPNRNDCPLCWRKDDDGSWDEEMIYRYLRIQYWHEDSYSQEMRRILQLEGSSSVTNNDNGHSNDDINIVGTLFHIIIFFVQLSIIITIFTTIIIPWCIRKHKMYRTGIQKKREK